MKIATRLVLSVFIFLAANVAAASETNRSGESSVEAELAALVLEALPLGAFQTPEVPNIVCPPGTYLLETPDMVLCIGEYDYREHAPPGTKKTLKACAVFPDFGNQPICILVHIICSDEGICRFRVVMPGVLQLLGLGSFDCVIVPDDQHTPQIIYCELPFRKERLPLECEIIVPISDPSDPTICYSCLRQWDYRREGGCISFRDNPVLPLLLPYFPGLTVPPQPTPLDIVPDDHRHPSHPVNPVICGS